MSEPTPAEQALVKNKIETPERPPHLDIVELMKEKNCYFVHMIQVNQNLDVSENNKVLDTNNLTVSDKLDILYGAGATLSTSTVRPDTQDGTFHGGFGVVLSQGEIVSAHTGDAGTIATSLTERSVFGVQQKSEKDVDDSIKRSHSGRGKSYNEVVVEQSEVAGGFMKLDDFKKYISYENKVSNYGSGGGDAATKVGVLDLTNEKDGSVFDVPFSVLLEMQQRGPIFFMDENNHLFTVNHIDEKTRKIEFLTTPILPTDIAEVYGDHKLNTYKKQEMLDRLVSKGVRLE